MPGCGRSMCSGSFCRRGIGSSLSKIEPPEPCHKILVGFHMGCWSLAHSLLRMFYVNSRGDRRIDCTHCHFVAIRRRVSAAREFDAQHTIRRGNGNRLVADRGDRHGTRGSAAIAGRRLGCGRGGGDPRLPRHHAVGEHQCHAEPTPRWVLRRHAGRGSAGALDGIKPNRKCGSRLDHPVHAAAATAVVHDPSDPLAWHRRPVERHAAVPDGVPDHRGCFGGGRPRGEAAAHTGGAGAGRQRTARCSATSFCLRRRR